MALLRDSPDEPVPKEIFFWTLWCKGDIKADTGNPDGRHSIQTNQRPTSLIRHFYAGCPSCHNLPKLSWLGTGTKYAGLHTHWLGSQWFG